jgi:hypothetical protein
MALGGVQDKLVLNNEQCQISTEQMRENTQAKGGWKT